MTGDTEPHDAGPHDAPPHGTQPGGALPTTRREEILAILGRDGTRRVTDLAAALGVTAVTVRRDIAQLADEGLVRRVHGGASLAAPEHPGRTSSGVVEGHDGLDETEPPVTATLGMVVPSLDYYWPGVLTGAREEAARLGARLVLRGSSYDPADDERQISWLVDQVGIDGLLCAPNLGGADGAALLAHLHRLDLPVVLVERTATVPPHHAPMESVSSDHALGAAMAVHHLASLGHRRVGLLVSEESPTAKHVRRGWLEACTQLGLPLDGTPDAASVNYRDAAWRESVDAVLDQCLATGTTALLVHSDPEAISLVERCEERGLAVPGTLSVVAYDDEVAGFANPPLTAVRPPRRSIGRAAVSLMVARLRDAGRPAHRVTVSPELLVRESSGPPSS